MLRRMSQLLAQSGLTVALGEPGDKPLRPIAGALRTIWNVLGETIAAHRRYEDLRFRGDPHDTAIRQALLHSQIQK
jgi:hypothetical protein